MSWISYSSLIPPNLFILLGIIGVVIAWTNKRIGLALATAAIGCLYLLSTPIVAVLLIRSSEATASAIPVTASAASPGAIIVLSADARHSEVRGEPVAVFNRHQLSPTITRSIKPAPGG